MHSPVFQLEECRVGLKKTVLGHLESWSSAHFLFCLTFIPEGGCWRGLGSNMSNWVKPSVLILSHTSSHHKSLISGPHHKDNVIPHCFEISSNIHFVYRLHWMRESCKSNLNSAPSCSCVSLQSKRFQHSQIWCNLFWNKKRWGPLISAVQLLQIVPSSPRPSSIWASFEQLAHPSHLSHPALWL